MATKNIFELAECLELKGVNHPILENAMIFAFGLDWEENSLYVEFYQYAKEGMYFDEVFNTWMIL